MVTVPLSSEQHVSLSKFRGAWLRPAAAACMATSFLVAGCRNSGEEIYHSTVSDRMIELRSGTAYVTEGSSTQAVHYELEDDKVVLHFPFMNTALRRMPDGSLSGMGEVLVKIDATTAALLGTYESAGGDYRLRLEMRGQAVYTRFGQPEVATYTFSGDQITLQQGSHSIPVRRRADGSLETADAVLQKLS